MRRANVQITQHRDPQLGFPSWKLHARMTHHQHTGLDPESPYRYQERRNKKRDGNNSDADLGANQTPRIR
jgi:hypothetical protein